MFRTFQLTFDEDILAFFGLALVLATFFKFGRYFFPKFLVTLHARLVAYHLCQPHENLYSYRPIGSYVILSQFGARPKKGL